MQLTRNFWLDEFEKSQYAARNGIDNHIPDSLMPSVKRMALFLQELRDRLSRHFGKDMPMIITSGYRCEELNTGIGGSQTSMHSYALAADIEVLGMTANELFNFIVCECRDMSFDQVIEEFGEWVHIGLSKTNKIPRKQTFYAYRRQDGKVNYLPHNASA